MTAHHDVEPPQEAVRLCLQCGKCVALCPAAREYPSFNPRAILLDYLAGATDAYTAVDSPIWACCACLACDHYCPQGAKPHQVVAALRARAAVPAIVGKVVSAVRGKGVSVAVGRGVARRRETLGLPDFPLVPPPAELFAE